MKLILTVVHIMTCFGLIFVVLLQRGSGDMGAAFGGGSSQSLFGARGSGSFMGKLTAGLATIFMVTSLILAFFSTDKGRVKSIMEGAPAQQEAPAAVPAPTGKTGPALPATDGDEIPAMPKSNE